MSKIRQSGMQKRGLLHETLSPNGLLLRGVVMATYVLDDPNHPANIRTSDDGKDPVAVYCDVLIYSTKRAFHCHCLSKVPVFQDRGGLHDGRIWMPKASTIDITLSPLDPNTGTFVGNMDGDHVLVGFLDDSTTLPMILGGIPHPSHDVGNLDQPPGHRRGLKLVDGHPDFFKHHGTFYGVDTNGNFIADTTFANDGTLFPDGREALPPIDGKGSQNANLPMDAEHRVEFFNMINPLVPLTKSHQSIKKDIYELSLDDLKIYFKLALAALEFHLLGGPTLKVEGFGPLAKLTLGDGAKSAIIAEAWEAFFDGAFKTWLTSHTHPTGVGPSGPPTESPSFPAYAVSAATSTKLKFPNL